jgi:DNA-binding NarL/FixJ family response regulator
MKRINATVSIADDHATVRIGLEQILSTIDGLQIGPKFADVPQLLAADLQAVDLLLLDLNMPGANGVSVVTALMERFPELKIIVFSLLPEESFAPRALAAGAKAYLNKSASPAQLVEAVEAVVEGRRYVPASQEEFLLTTATTAFTPPHDRLGPREFEILLLLAGGMKPTEIAARFDLRVGTVTTHIHRLKKKLGARSLGELIAYVHQHRLLGI